MIFLLFGPLAGLGTYLRADRQRSRCGALLLSCVVGVLATTILFLHHFPQHAADAKHGKRTPIVRLGPEGAGRLVPWLLGLAATRSCSPRSRAARCRPSALAFFSTAPLALRAARTALANADDARAMTRAFSQTMGFALGGGLALAGGLAAASLL